jgi:SAM-dependent methyltransferase
MQDPNEIKKTVQERFHHELTYKDDYMEEGCGCGSGCGCSSYADTAENYTELEGYHPHADLGLGCGLPTEFIDIREGDTVVDLGCGAGNDCFVARERTGLTGKVIGVDITESMIERARKNAEMAGYNNVEFRLGDVENLPVSDQTANAVICNCVLNLVPDKSIALLESYRVMKHHGHLSIAEIVVIGNMPQALKEDAEMYAGCLTGAMAKDDFLRLVEVSGFENVRTADMKPVELPDAMLRSHLSDDQHREYQKGMFGLFTITATADKPCCKSGKKGHENHEHHHEPGHKCACGNH